MELPEGTEPRAHCCCIQAASPGRRLGAEKKPAFPLEARAPPASTNIRAVTQRATLRFIELGAADPTLLLRFKRRSFRFARPALLTRCILFVDAT